MQIHRLDGLDGATAAMGLTVIIDAFRAFTTACYALNQAPRAYLLVGDGDTAAELRSTAKKPLLIGKPEPGASFVAYDIPNSPTRLLEHPIAGRTIIHRTAAGARGVLAASRATEIICAAFVNGGAVARYIRARRPDVVTLVSMGHEGVTPSIEDTLCAAGIDASLSGRTLDLTSLLGALRDGPGRYLSGADHEEYPRADFARCTEVDRFPFALRAERCGAYARLSRIDV